MAECNSEKEKLDLNMDKYHTETSLYDIEPCDVMTGDKNKNRYLLYQLKMSILKAKKIDIIVSFLMESGVRLLLKDLKNALDRGVQIRLLTGNYLGITQPGALFLVKKELGNRVDLRFYNNKEKSFHPKAYMFHGEEVSEIYIGSSNVSRSALTSGVEWNYRFSSETDKTNFELFYHTFEDLFHNHSIRIDDEELKRYAYNWKKPAVQKDLDKYDNVSSTNTNVQELFEPRGVQIEALYALDANREEGAKRAVIQAATGVGKTYLAAFDSVGYKRILFVAHRQEILSQAANSFRNVRKSDDFGYFNDKNKDTDKSVIFASIASLGKSKYLNEDYFAPDYFDYIVIDEFHHAVNNQYMNVINYFKPKFLLGLTATPDRMDGRSVYEICDYSVPYEITLKTAINKGVLVPFHYYGIYDETDYSNLHIVKGKYTEEELNKLYIGNVVRYDLIYKNYQKYRSKRALGFCSSRAHAEEMAKQFNQRGIPSVAVYSNANGEFSADRQIAIERLINNEIKIIFSVDMFNEGVDIPSVDMVMFLRPTESPVVFLQQLGRGLRKDGNKEYLNVLDFIGNYKKAGNAPFLLSGQNYSTERATRDSRQDFEFPDDCLVDFDIRLIDLFKTMAKSSLKVKERIYNEYLCVKDELEGKVPNRMELFTLMDDEIYQICMNKSKENPFRNYLGYLYELNELSPEEETLYNTIGREFLNILETTDMQKSYKMPILLTFYNSGNIKMAITEEDVYNSWKQFYDTGTNWKDINTVQTLQDYKKISKMNHISNAKRNPINFLRKSGKGFFVDKAGYVLALNDELSSVIKDLAFIKHMKDSIDYRTMEYYRRRYEEKR